MPFALVVLILMASVAAMLLAFVYGKPPLFVLVLIQEMFIQRLSRRFDGPFRYNYNKR